MTKTTTTSWRGESLVLSAIDLFRSLGPDDLERIAGLLRRRRYARGETIFIQGDLGTNLCIVESGMVKLVLASESRGREVAIAHCTAGDVFGELALIDGGPRSADAVAVSPTSLLLLSSADFRRELETHPRLALAMLAKASRMLRRDTQTLQDLAFLDVPGRISQVALDLARPQPDGTLRTDRMSQSDFAALARTTRETLNKFLGLFTDAGLLRWERGQVIVCKPNELRMRIC